MGEREGWEGGKERKEEEEDEDSVQGGGRWKGVETRHAHSDCVFVTPLCSFVNACLTGCYFNASLLLLARTGNIHILNKYWFVFTPPS